jgi:predicted RNA-binding protein with PIN domain
VEVPDQLLRPALELAWAIAAFGADQRPPRPAPKALRPLLQFKKLPNKALSTVRKVLEDDESFRILVATAADQATEDIVGRPSWLWLHRPDGWEDELAALVDAEPGHGRSPAKDDADRALAARLERAESRVRQQTAELEVLRSEVQRARQAREQADAELAKVTTRAEELERAADRLRRKSEREGGDLHAAQETAAAGRDEIEALRVELSEAERKLAEVARGSEAAAPLDLAALDGAVTVAAELAATLRELAGSLRPAGPAPGAPEAPAPPVIASSTRATVRRRALRIPRGLHAGTLAADTWLLTGAGARLVVDGYNVAKLGWPDQVLADQRDRLVDLLDDLAVRHQASIEVVFDGADVGAFRTGRRRHVEVSFSPAGVLADDVIRERVATVPVERPVVVVTDDRAVVDDVRAAGANVVTSAGLLAVARR